jgi:single-stranded DNA-binding protein
MFSLNDVFLAGTLAKDPTTSFQDNGTQVTSVRLCVLEESNGQTSRTWIPVEAWGKSAQILADLSEGDACLIQGKLQWKSWEKDGKKQGMFIVSTWSVQALAVAEAAV